MNSDDSLVSELIASLRLRSVLKMIREPDQVVDHLLGNHLGIPVYSYTGDLDWARHWVGLLTPDLVVGDPIKLANSMFGVRVYLNQAEVPIWMAALNPAIPACFAGLNRRIDILLDQMK